jgi:hypothetical protein
LKYCLHMCTPLSAPIPLKFLGNRDEAMRVELPDFPGLANFTVKATQELTRDFPSEFPKGTSCCAMCGDACWDKKKVEIRHAIMKRKNIYYGADYNEFGGVTSSNFNPTDDESMPHIPTQNKGVCNRCDTQVWVHEKTSLQMKWCKACKNFIAWAAFGEKGSATKCVPCRDRQKQSYALKKATRYVIVDEVKK